MACERQKELKLYVATDLSWFEDSDGHLCADDLMHGGRAFRSIAPKYLAWIRNRMLRLAELTAAGAVSRETYARYKKDYDFIVERSLAIFGAQTLAEAVKSCTPHEYRPPTVSDHFWYMTPEECWQAMQEHPDFRFPGNFEDYPPAQCDPLRQQALGAGLDPVEVIERAAILQYDCRMPREEAEKRAVEDLLAQRRMSDDAAG